MKAPLTTFWQPFLQLVAAHQRFVLTSHVRPDCDALGSELGLAYILESLGKQVRIINADVPPRHLKFLDAHGRFEQLGTSVNPADVSWAEVIIVLDTSAWIQLGAMADVLRTSRAVKVVVDHHRDGDELGALELKDVEAEATGRLVFDAAQELGAKITPEIALPLFAAIATDTGWFRFSSTTANTYRVAGHLVDCGANPQAIYSALYEQDPLGRVHLRGLILQRAALEHSGRIVHTHVLQQDFAELGCVPADTEDAVNLTLAVAGVEAAVIFVEQPGGRFKVSFRSRGRVDCSEVARQFGGGGHKAAAGAIIPGRFAAVLKQVLDALRARMP